MQDYKFLNILGSITNLRILVEFYLENKEAIGQKVFISRYAALLESTEKCFSSKSDWYVSNYILPVLQRKKNMGHIFQYLLEKEKKFIESNLPKDCTLLDVGCGPGRIPITFYNNRKIKKILAFDISAEMIKKALALKEQYGVDGKIDFFRADITTLPKLYLDNPVIITCMFGTLGNIPKYDDRISALKNMKKNINEGKILLDVFNMDKLELARQYYSSLKDGWGDSLEVLDDSKEKTYFLFPESGLFATWYTKKGIKDELKEAGFRNIEVEPCGEHLFVSIELKEGQN